MFLHQHVVDVEEGVQRGVEGHHEDGHSDAEFVRNGSSCGGQLTQQADREPTQEVRQNNGGQAARDGGVSGPRFLRRGYGVGAHRPVDERLAHSDQQEQYKVQNDHHAEGAVVTVWQLIVSSTIMPGSGDPVFVINDKGLPDKTRTRRLFKEWNCCMPMCSSPFPLRSKCLRLGSIKIGYVSMRQSDRRRCISRRLLDKSLGVIPEPLASR